MSLGALNPCAFQCGGGPTLVEKIYRALRASLGRDGAGPEGGLEDTWRIAKAIAIAKALSAGERAAMQAFPNLGVEHLPIYEGILGVRDGETLAERTEAVAAAYVGVPDATDTGLEGALKKIDPSIELVIVDRDSSAISRYGYPFGADYVAYSEHFFAFVEWPAIDESKRATVERLLNKALPAWCDFSIYQSRGFVLDESELDVTYMADT